MSVWHWLIGGVAVLGLTAGLYGLHRLARWLEDRGWLFYTRTKPSSSPASCWVALQQAIEPGAQHVIHLKEEQPKQDEAVVKERLLAGLLPCFEQGPVNPEEVRHYLTSAKRAGLDWQALYAEAVGVQGAVQPDQAGLLPPLASVAPPD
jgi:hypothetical protein